MEPWKQVPDVKLYSEPDGRCLVIDNESATSSLYVAHSARADRYIYGIDHVTDSLLRRYFPDGDAGTRLNNAIVIDVGANIGEFTLAALACGAEKIFAFEPDPAAYACLQLNTARFPHVCAMDVCLNAEDGPVDFYIATSNADSSIIEPWSWSQTSVIEGRRLDGFQHVLESIHDDRPLILKVEAEGAEPEVLQGAERLLQKKGKLFVTVRASFERRGKSTMPQCEEILNSHGLQLWRGADGKQLLGERSTGK